MAGDVRQKPPDNDLVGVVVESHGMNSVRSESSWTRTILCELERGKEAYSSWTE